MVSILLNYKMNTISKAFCFLKFNLFMQNLSVPRMIRFSTHIMKDTLFKRGVTLWKQSKSLVKKMNKMKTLQENYFFLQTT